MALRGLNSACMMSERKLNSVDFAEVSEIFVIQDAISFRMISIDVACLASSRLMYLCQITRLMVTGAFRHNTYINLARF